MSSYFHILPPHQVPTPASIQNSPRVGYLRHILADIQLKSWDTNVNAAEDLSLTIATLDAEPSSYKLLSTALQSDGTKASSDDNAHDEYFYVRRLGGPSPDLFLHSILKANWILFRDCQDSAFTIAADKLNLLDQSLNELLGFALGLPVGVTPRVTQWKSLDSIVHSMQRWIRGHQIFAVLTQGLIAAFVELRRGLRKMDEATVATAVDLGELLLRASAVALEFTGDFPQQDYTDIIRPSMTPPLVPETFSGLLSVDHRFFVQLMREMKPALDALSQYPAAYHERIASAVATVYDSHRFVCDRLVGKCPSLMMSSGSKKTGAEQIEKFKHLRLKVFQTAPHLAVPKGTQSNPPSKQ